jgi:hypothetical protein
LATVDERLHHGQITWWIRIGSWALVTVPVSFVNPWLVLPAIVLVELAWIVGLRWSWRRQERRPIPRTWRP